MAAHEIHNTRVEVATTLQERVVATLRKLGMEDARFEVAITPIDTFTPNGTDSIAYLFTANRTTRPAPIERVASGGELSRMMLALKALLAEKIELQLTSYRA